MSEDFSNPSNVEANQSFTGLSGLTAAAILAERGRRVAVVENDLSLRPLAGAAPSYHRIRRSHGASAARELGEAVKAAAAFVERTCGVQRVTRYLYTERRRYVAEVKNETNAAREAGLDVQFTTDVPLPFPTRGAAIFTNEIHFNRDAYVNALRAKVDIDPGTPSNAIRVHGIALDYGRPGPEGIFCDTAEPPHHTVWIGTTLRIESESEEDLLQYAREIYGELPVIDRWTRMAAPEADIVAVARGMAMADAAPATGLR